MTINVIVQTHFVNQLFLFLSHPSHVTTTLIIMTIIRRRREEEEEDE